jgi:golgi phosphoprotein 3
MLKLAEELLLLAYDDEKGNIICNSTALSYALPGALLTELALLEKIRFEENYLVLVDNRLTGDDILDEVVSIMQQSSRLKNPQKWVRQLKSEINNLRGRLSAQLIDEGILSAKEEKFLWIFSSIRYPAIDISYKRAIINRIRTAVLEAEIIPSRTAALISLIGICNLVNSIFTQSERKEARQRIKLIQKENIISEGVAATIKSVQAATTAAISASIATSSSSS